ncbi:hypothetical protein C7999DRAFT_44255 [Corynascus novoguineensis]|uniref:Uncharacterized protein n=1 Tax=Corynascus novoguineensis TaxID=1126955 RepID=A0AAN7CMM0_9PEZI|nr:hypothetical protein C7999DRAFT_44255 [Corynascus novoguineensis]
MADYVQKGLGGVRSLTTWQISGGGGRTMGRTPVNTAWRDERKAKVFHGLEYREDLDLEALNTPAEPVGITSVEYLGSFNKVSDGEIAVPGAPPKLNPLTESLKMNAKSRKRVTSVEYPQYAHMFEPLLRSVELMRPTFDLLSVTDVISNASNLRKLFEILQNRIWAVDRFEIEMRGNTMLLSRWNQDPNLSRNLGHGARFERRTCRYTSEEDDVVQRSMSHHLVVSYDFCGLRCVVQGEVDAYYCDHEHSHNDNHGQNSPSASPPRPEPSVLGHAKRYSDPLPLGGHPRRQSSQNTPTPQPQLFNKHKLSSPSRAFAALALDDPGDSPSFLDNHPSSATTMAKTSTPSPTLRVHHAGRRIPPRCLVEVKTRNVNTLPLSCSEAQLYFARRSRLYLAEHDKGLFLPSPGSSPDLAVPDAVRDVDRELEGWEQNYTATLGRVAAFLRLVRERVVALNRRRGVGVDGRADKGIWACLYEQVGGGEDEEKGGGGVLPP